jgi:hypothetical protein
MVDNPHTKGAKISCKTVCVRFKKAREGNRGARVARTPNMVTCTCLAGAFVIRKIWPAKQNLATPSSASPTTHDAKTGCSTLCAGTENTRKASRAVSSSVTLEHRVFAFEHHLSGRFLGNHCGSCGFWDMEVLCWTEQCTFGCRR